MKLLIMCSILAFVWLQLPSEGEGVCCYRHNYQHSLMVERKRCNDCRRAKFLYCGVGSCNAFGCNCDRGCRKGACHTPSYYSILGRKRAVAMETEDARDVIRAADQDGDGRMSLEEAYAHLDQTFAREVKRSLVSDKVKRSLEAMDVDRDRFLTAEEIDS